MVFQWFPMLANHWSDDGMVTIHCSGLDNGPGPGRNYGETGVFTVGQKVFFGLKMGFTAKNHPK